MLRGWALIVLVGSLAVSGYYRARARRLGGVIERRREGGAALLARAAGGLAGMAAILAHALAPGAMAWASFPAPGWMRAAGAVLGLLVLPGTYWVFSSIGQNVSETVLPDHALVQHGPYRWVRHPLYTTGALLLLALGLMLSSWLILALAIIAFAIFRWFVVPLEERQLEQTFGDRYRAYARGTGAMLPRLPRRGP
jgi:protein-S-isoprenylcysteine O-methyltransferase Ste14